MAGEWRDTSLGEVVRLQRGHDLPEKERTLGLVPVMGSFGLTGWHDDVRAKGPGVTIGRSGSSIGVVAFVESDYWPLNTCLYVTDFQGNDPRFCYYWLRTLNLANYNSGSAQPSLNRNYIYGMPVRIPELKDQRAIAHILGTLDDKIELNRKMNETLEAMAQAIFRKWFVEPVEDGVPDGWRETTIGELCEFVYGKSLKENERQPGPVPVYGSNGQIGWHDEALVKGPGIIVGRKGNPGMVTWVSTDFFPIDTTFYVVPKGECQSLSFLFYALRIHDLASLGADSAVPGLNRNVAYMSKQVVPPRSVLEAFDKQVRSLFERIHHNAEESRTLAAIRDELLPKLISGQIRTRTQELDPLAKEMDIVNHE